MNAEAIEFGWVIRVALYSGTLALLIAWLREHPRSGPAWAGTFVTLNWIVVTLYQISQGLGSGDNYLAAGIAWGHAATAALISFAVYHARSRERNDRQAVTELMILKNGHEEEEAV